MEKDSRPPGAARELYLGENQHTLRKKGIAVSLFTKNREHEVQSLMLNLVNNNCPGLKGLAEGPRLERRVNLTVVVLVIPFENGKAIVGERFAAVTKEFTSRGVSLVLHECHAADNVILGFRWERSMKFILAQARHLNPMGGGFWQLGLRLKEVVHPDVYPELENVRI